MTTNPYNQVGAYKTHQDTIINSRDIDARALLTCAGKLQAIVDGAITDAKECGDAIRLNQKLWTIFQVSLCDPDNPLPKDLKLNLLSLSKYVDRTSFEAVSSLKPHLLRSLIDINRIIASGLAKKVEQQSATSGIPAPAFVAADPSKPVSVLTSA